MSKKNPPDVISHSMKQEAARPAEPEQEESESGDWSPYLGPQGGFGWQNTNTGEVLYQEEPPGEVDLSGLDPEEKEEIAVNLFEQGTDISDQIEGKEVDFTFTDLSPEDIKEGTVIRSEEEEYEITEVVGDPEDDVRDTYALLDGGEKVMYAEREVVPDEFGYNDRVRFWEAKKKEPSLRDEMPEPDEVDESEVDFNLANAKEGREIVMEAYTGDEWVGEIREINDGRIEVEWNTPEGRAINSHDEYDLKNAKYTDETAPETPDRDNFDDVLVEIEKLDPVWEIDRDLRRKTVVSEDGKKWYVQDYRREYDQDDIVKLKQLDKDGNRIKDEEGNQVGKDVPKSEAVDYIEATVHKEATVEDFTDEHVRGMGPSVMFGMFDPAGSPNYDWKAVREIFDKTDSEVIKETLVDSTLYGNDGNIPSVTIGNADLEELWEFSYEKGDPKDERGTRHPRSIGILFSHMDGDDTVEAVSEIRQELEESEHWSGEINGEWERGEHDDAQEMFDTIYTSAYMYAADHEARERIEEEHGDVFAQARGRQGDNAIEMLSTEDYEDFKSAWIGGWHTRSGNNVAVLTQHALRDFGPNEGDELTVWSGGRPVGDVDIPDTTIEHFEEMYERTQEELDGDEKLYRGTYDRVTTHSCLESWSEMKSIAEKFDDHILEAEVEPEDVLATWDILGEDWPEDYVKGKKEWMILGGGFDE